MIDPFEADDIDPDSVEEPEGDEPMETLAHLIDYLETAAATETIVTETLGTHPAADTHSARAEAFRDALVMARRLEETSESDGRRGLALPEPTRGDAPPSDEVGSVPADLVDWFGGGQILAERHNLRRIQGRFRVVQVRTIFGDEDEPYIIKGEWREFKTQAAAVKLQKRWADEGHATLLQTGFTFWPDADEMPDAG